MKKKKLNNILDVSLFNIKDLFKIRGGSRSIGPICDSIVSKKCTSSNCYSNAPAVCSTSMCNNASCATNSVPPS